jgi:hypothetical protein
LRGPELGLVDRLSPLLTRKRIDVDNTRQLQPRIAGRDEVGARQCRKTARPLAPDTRNEGEDGPAYRSHGF